MTGSHAEAPLRFPYAYAFAGSGCLLVLELVAGRILAPTLGVSLYTWTSVIGVVLAGISAGNYLGGRLADRWPGRVTLSAIFLLSALASALILALANDLESLTAPRDWPAIARVVWLTAVLFLLPSTLLAMITPMLAKLTLESLDATGRVIGRIQASAALGSIVGTFGTGFFFISWFGTKSIVGGVAAALLMLGIASSASWTLPRVALIGLTAAAVATAWWWTSSSGCLRESNYYCIRVETRGSNTRALILDRNVHGVVDLQDPSRLVVPYEQMIDQILTAVLPAGEDADAFAIGGGTYSFPRYFIARYRGTVLVAEIDPAVTEVARAQFGLKDDPRIEIVHDDARAVLRDLPAERRFDVVLADAFMDSTVPYQLTTREFNELVASHLSPGGLYLASIVDGSKYEFLRSYIKTLQLTFPHVTLLARSEARSFDGISSNFVVVASDNPLPNVQPTVSSAELQNFLADGHSVILTDDHPPVDQLLSPTYR